MRTITIYYDGRAYTYRWLKVLYVARSYFKDLGYNIEWSNVLDLFPGYPRAEEMTLKRLCHRKNDIAFLAFHHSTSLLGKDNRLRGGILTEVRKRTNTLVWLDTADSTGTCLFDVMPYVDIYMKKQLLVNKYDYFTPMYGGRLYCDYYHKLLHVEDKAIVRDYSILQPGDLKKLRLGWNVGLGDLFTGNGTIGKTALRNPWALSHPTMGCPRSKKTIDLHYRGSGYSPIAGYQRQKLCELVSQTNIVNHPNVYQKVSHKKYIQELALSKAILSPFGWGEVCGRDFEAFQYGAILIKPSMTHVETFPDVYRENDTYVSLDWDFSNLETVLLNLKNGIYDEIADKGQTYFKYCRSAEGLQNFAKHIVNQLNI